MLRKLVSTLTIFALALVGLSQVSPAQAAGTFTPNVTLPEGVNGATSIPLGDSGQLKIWVAAYNNGSSIKTGILHSDGTWSNQDDLVTSSSSLYFRLSETRSWAINHEGTIAFTWTQSSSTRQNNVNILTTESFIAYTDDGIDWSAPVQVFAPRVVSDGGSDCWMFYECGFSAAQLAVDSKGVLTAFIKFYDGSNSSLLVSTSRDGVIWSAPTQLDSSGSSYGFYYVQITPIPAGGFMAVWVSSNQTQSFKYSTMSPNTYSFWQRPKTLGAVENLETEPVLLQTDLTHLSLFFLTATNTTPVLHQRIFDLVSKTWASSTVVANFPQDYVSSRIQATMGANWHAAIGVSMVLNGQAEGRAYLVEVKNSVPGEAKLVKTSTEQAMMIPAMRVNFDDSITLMLNGLNRRANIMTIVAGAVVSDETVPTTGAEQLYGFGVTVSPSGNFFISSIFNTGTSQIYEGTVYRQASVPVPTGAALKLSGVAQNAKVLSATIPTFTGVTQVGLTKIQWYACASKVLTVQTSVPAGCVLIAKATASKFKVTTKQKNKYLAVAVTNTNAVGTTTLFSPTTAKAK